MQFVIITLVCLETSRQQNIGNDKINEAASTSKQNQDLDRCELCEIERYASEVVDLMLAEDSTGDTLKDLIINKIDELKTYA